MSSQANSNQQNEPTMEEILASIRKIIYEDQPSDGKSAARPAPAKPQPALAAEVAVVRVAAAATATELDVLDLTDEVPEDDAIDAVSAASAPASAIGNGAMAQSTEPVSNVKEGPMDDFVSDTTRQAMGKAFANVNGLAPSVALKGSSVEAIFADAVQQAFRPALKEWVDDHSADVMDQLRPLIRAWMDEHLPSLIEAAVVKEIAHAARKL
jgi:cell pole-organizing protein PopZ